MQTPTKDPTLFPRTDKATPTPEGIATSKPIPSDLSWPLDFISSVIKTPVKTEKGLRIETNSLN